ncbi:ribonuclease Z, partial [Candidatus Woesearchaeota archaeon]|nr:ribonuclease Z [Candidatus Woesearchaeota archaeon]
AEQAAGIAQQAGAKKLILTHFSQRYKDLNPMLDEAQTLHNDTKLAYDFMKIEL